MAKRKGREELFEIFQRKEAAKRGMAKEGIPGELEEKAEGEEKLAPSGKPPFFAIRREPAHRFSLGARPQIVFSLSFNACIVLAVGFVVFCGLIYGIGFGLGKSGRPRALEEIRSTIEKEPGPLDLGPDRRAAEAVAPVVGDYALRIISYGAGQEKKVQEVLQFLEKEGVPRLDSVKTQSGRFIVLYSGPYPKGDDPALIELRERVRGLLFKGREDFKDADIVRFVRR